MTKIASVATYPISVPRPEPVWTAQEESKAWSVILTEVKTDDGLVGYGADPRRADAAHLRVGRALRRDRPRHGRAGA